MLKGHLGLVVFNFLVYLFQSRLFDSCLFFSRLFIPQQFISMGKCRNALVYALLYHWLVLAECPVWESCFPQDIDKDISA